MTDDTRAARKPGWYWVRSDGMPDPIEWVVAFWHDGVDDSGYWTSEKWTTPAFDEHLAEIDERRITREPVAPVGDDGADNWFHAYPFFTHRS